MAPPSAALVLLLAAVTSPVLADDTCPDGPAVANFDSSAFLGRWYSVKQTVAQGNSTYKCLSTLVKPVVEHTARLATNTRYLDHTHLSIHVMLGVLFKVDNSSTDGKYFYSRRMSDTESDKRYHIIATDYVNYAVTWYCFPSTTAGQVEQIYSLMTRQASPDAELLRDAGQHLPEGRYVNVSQEQCPGQGRPRSLAGSTELEEPESSTSESVVDEV